MLAYTIGLGLFAVLVHFYGHHDSTTRYPLAYRIWETFVTTILLFAGNLLYSFGYVTPLLRKIWKFVFPILVLQFVISGILQFYFPDPSQPAKPVVAVLATITMIALFFPTLRAHFLLGYGDIARVRAIEPPAVISTDPLYLLIAEIRKLRRTALTASIVAIMLLTALVINSYFQVHFEPKDDSWVTVRRLGDAAKYEEALAVAQRLVDKDPDSPQTRVLMGTLQLSLGKLHQAEASFTRAYELLPNEFHANLLNAVRRRIDETEPTPTPSTTP